MPNSPFLKTLFVVCLVFLSTNIYSTVFNVSNTPQLRQAFLDSALNGQADTIVLAPGIYKTTSDGLGAFRFSDAEAFSLTIEGSATNRSAVILDGDGADDVFSLLNNDDSSLSSLLLKNLTIRNAGGSGVDADFKGIHFDNISVASNSGTGLYASGDILTVDNAEIKDNGRGISASGGSLVIRDSVINNNRIDGGISAVVDLLDIRDSTIKNNRTGGAGGGVYVHGYDISIKNTSITGNIASEGGWSLTPGAGGGIAITYEVCWRRNAVQILLVNNVLAFNTAKYGPAVWSTQTSNFVNNTIAFNNTSEYSSSGAIHAGYAECTPDIHNVYVNNVFFNNESDVSYSSYSDRIGAFYNNYIDYWKLDPASLMKDNILPSEGDPDFIDTEFRIGADSVVIDKGLDPSSETFADLFTSETLPIVRNALRTDKDGQPRVFGSEIDMGAYEYDPDYSPPTDLSGTIKTADGTNVCAMVLASGQYTFSCNPPGVFSLTNLPSESDGTVKRQIYADGFFPEVDTLPGSSVDAVVMTRSGSCPNYNTPYLPADVPGSAGKRIDISGKVLLHDTQAPICAMVLANGQYTFSCDGTGNYALNIPMDNNGQFKLQVYADGFAPKTQTFDEFQVINDVRLARAADCARSGEQVYNATCQACHSTGVAGAPIVGDQAAWAPRILKGIDGLLATAISGLNDMPPKGSCADCSDQELKAAIEYMLSQSGY